MTESRHIPVYMSNVTLNQIDHRTKATDAKCAVLTVNNSLHRPNKYSQFVSNSCEIDVISLRILPYLLSRSPSNVSCLPSHRHRAQSLGIYGHYPLAEGPSPLHFPGQ